MSIRSCLVPRFLVPLFAVLGPSVMHAAAPQARIRTAVTDADRAPVRETISPRVKQSADQGEAASDLTLSAVTLHFSLTDAQQADLTQLLANQQNPSSPQYHQWLTPQQYGARFGLSSADMAKVQTWLSGKGLQVIAIAPSQNSITVSGSVGQIESAFNTSIHALSENGVQHISNVTDPQLPAAITSLVVGITGLNDFKPRSHAIVKPHFTSSTTGSHYIAPGDFYTIYDLNPLLQQQSITGTRSTIAIVGQTDISLSDVAAFRSASGLAAKAPTVVQATGYVSGTVSGDVDEAQLDVEWSGAVAPNATIKFVTVGASQTTSVIDALIYAITSSNVGASIISISYGGYESSWGQSDLNTVNQYLQQANAQGITVFAASGDSGATDADDAPPADFGLVVEFPGSSPFTTAAGGTMFNEGSATGATAYWNSNSSSSSNNAGSALSYIPETVWNESNSTTLSAGGGGASAYFAKPAWQVGTGVPADNVRDVPDISLNAAASHDGYLFCSQGSCTNGFRNSAGNLNVVGGTSVVAPTLAGIFALLEDSIAQQHGSNTATGLGNINPMIYGLANGQNASSVFHDITTGNNSSTCQLGTTDCPNGGSIGYSAGTGYDLATGWGSLDVANLASKWSTATPAGGGSSTTGSTLSNTAVTTANSSTCGVSGALSLTITVTNASTNTSLGTPTGNVQIMLDSKPVSGAVVALSNGSATYSFTNGQISGSHKVGAVYLGDTTYAGSQGTLSADFVYSSQADFSLSPCANSTSVASGATASGITFTVASKNSFSGPVTFSVVATSSIAATYSFSASSVNLSSGSTGTTTLTITASQTTTTSSLRKDGSPASRSRWYMVGSGVTLAGLFLLAVPRRRRFTPLIVLLLSVGTFSIAGCGGSGSSSGSSSSTGGTKTNATRGTYILDVTATAANGLVHTSTVTLTVQ